MAGLQSSKHERDPSVAIWRGERTAASERARRDQLDGKTLVVRIPMRFQRRGGLACAHRWQQMLEQGDVIRLSEMLQGGSFEQEEAP